TAAHESAMLRGRTIGIHGASTVGRNTLAVHFHVAIRARHVLAAAACGPIAGHVARALKLPALAGLWVLRVVVCVGIVGAIAVGRRITCRQNRTTQNERCEPHGISYRAPRSGRACFT